MYSGTLIQDLFAMVRKAERFAAQSPVQNPHEDAAEDAAKPARTQHSRPQPESAQTRTNIDKYFRDQYNRKEPERRLATATASESE